MDIHLKIEQARISAGLTQAEMADKLGIERSTYQYWEKKTPSIAKIKSIEKALNLPKGYFTDEKFGNDERIVSKSDKTDPETEIQRIRREKIFESEQKGIIAVPLKAQANYTKRIDDVVYYSQLERIYFPNIPYDGDNYRFFQVEGDSMEYIDEVTKTVKGIEDGAWVLVEKVPMEDWKENLRMYLVYVIVTKNRITLKRILRDNPNEIVLHADNEIYGQERLPLSEVQEIWIFRRKLDWSAPPPRKIEIKV